MDTSNKSQPTPNGSSEITYKAVDYAAHHFKVADEGVGVLHIRVDLQPALLQDSMHDRGGAPVELA
jgi:hypothetical protein